MRRLLIIGLVLMSQGSFSASFDCAKASLPQEKIVCSNPELGRLDDALAKAYNDTKDKFSNEGKIAIKADEARWLKGLKSSCDINSSFENNIPRISSCLTKEYKARISVLNRQAIPVNGYLSYSITTKNVSFEQIDGAGQSIQRINAYSRAAALDFLAINKDDTYSVYISFPTKYIIQVTEHIETSGGVYLDSASSNSYFMSADGRMLKGDDFFIKSKIDEFSALLIREIRKGADKETKDCYETVDQKGIKSDLMSLKGVLLMKGGISLSLGVPHYCRALDLVDFGINTINPFVTEFYRANFSKQ
jgi:uncharacterized protein